MNARLLLPLIVVVTLAFTARADLATDFDVANKSFAAGKFQEAADAYDRCIAAHGVSGPLLFNLGNAHFKAGRLGLAIASYRGSLQLSPRDADTLANLQFARARVTGVTVHARFWERWLSRLSLGEWTWLAAVSVWLVFGLLTLRQLKPALAASSRGVLLISVLVCAGCIACLIAANALAGRETAIVIAPEISVRTSPFDEAPGSFSANDGAELRVLDRKDVWWQVGDGSHRVGWVKGEHVVVQPRR